MNFVPLEEGGLRVELESERDWRSFELLFLDAQGRGQDWLAKRFGVLVDEEDWDEFVVPDLSAHFSQQIETTRQTLAQAFEAAEDGCGEFVISVESGETWYGVMNQARLALEGRWKLSQLAAGKELDRPENVDPERLAAFLRSELYGRMQERVFVFTFGSL